MIGCCSSKGRGRIQIRFGKGVWYCDVPGFPLAHGMCAVPSERLPSVLARPQRFSNGKDLCTFESLPYDVVLCQVSLLPDCTFTKRYTVESSSLLACHVHRYDLRSCAITKCYSNRLIITSESQCRYRLEPVTSRQNGLMLRLGRALSVLEYGSNSTVQRFLDVSKHAAVCATLNNNRDYGRRVLSIFVSRDGCGSMEFCNV